MSVAALQMVSGSELEANLNVAAALICRAADAGAVLAVLPESFAMFGDPFANRELAKDEARSAGLCRWLGRQAKQSGLVLVGGTVPVLGDDGRAWATCYVHGPDGGLLGRYRKMHLFDARVGDRKGRYCESEEYRPGEAPLVIETPLGRLGLAVCYDLRFAAQFQWMREQGAQIIAVPSAFTRRTGLAHWLPLLRARAIETQCMVLGANQGGRHTLERETSGGSAIIDAWGEVRAEAGFGECAVLSDWDRAFQQQLRASMPVASSARFSVQLKD